MVCENCGKDVTGTEYDRKCAFCGRVRCSPECHVALMRMDDRHKASNTEDE